MGVRRCLAWPDPRLRRPAKAISEITEDIHALWRDMIDTMEAMPGVGLAAPQIGKMLRLAVIDASDARGVEGVCARVLRPAQLRQRLRAARGRRGAHAWLAAHLQRVPAQHHD